MRDAPSSFFSANRPVWGKPFRKKAVMDGRESDIVGLQSDFPSFQVSGSQGANFLGPGLQGGGVWII